MGRQKGGSGFSGWWFGVVCVVPERDGGVGVGHLPVMGWQTAVPCSKSEKGAAGCVSRSISTRVPES